MLRKPLPTTLQGFLFNKWPAHYAYRFLSLTSWPTIEDREDWAGLHWAPGLTLREGPKCWTSDLRADGQHRTTQSFVNQNL